MASLAPPTSQTFKPLNEEPPAKKLISSQITSTSDSYHRNHGPIPHLDGSMHRIKIKDIRNSPSSSGDLSLQKEFTLSLQDLENLPQTTITCALQCAGNRRHDMRTRLKEVQGIDWGSGAVMNASWTGVLLVDLFSHLLSKPVDDLLSPSSLPPNASNTEEDHTSGRGHLPNPKQESHIAFSCTSVPTEEDTYFGSSLPLSLALRPSRQILLATKQNSQPLTAEHGFPVRLIVPGIAGARSVKWLDTITLQDRESTCFYMQRDYKLLPPEVTDGRMAEEWWDKVRPLGDMPVNSVIVSVTTEDEDNDSDGANDQDTIIPVKRDIDGRVVVKGYALPGGDGGPVTRVEIRIDGHGEWEDAELLPARTSSEDKDEDASRGKWSWMLWRAVIKIDVGRHTIWSRASDFAGHRQEEERSEWNLRGVAYNGFGEVEVDVS